MGVLVDVVCTERMICEHRPNADEAGKVRELWWPDSSSPAKPYLNTLLPLAEEAALNRSFNAPRTTEAAHVFAQNTHICIHTYIGICIMGFGHQRVTL
jgi:hypothetical protein